MRIKFVTAAWPDLRQMKTGFLKMLREKYEAVSVDSNADIIIYETNPITDEPSLLKIFISGENTYPANPSEFDLVLGFKEKSINAYRLPLWTFYVDWDENSDAINSITTLKNQRTVDESVQRKRFCGFVSCKERPYRMNFVKKLSNYKIVTCAGKVMNNFEQIGPQQEDKIAFLQTCKFCIAFENEGPSDLEGYVTEKIIEAFAAGCIPIYWGDPNINKVFNPKAFLNRQNYLSDEEFIQAIQEIDTDDRKYWSMRQEPAILNIPETFYPTAVCEKIDKMLQNTFKVQFFYGSGAHQVNVTQTGKTIFCAENKISIRSDVSFNNVFGDVLPNVPKLLTIKNYNNGAITTLPEKRAGDFEMTISQLQSNANDIYSKFCDCCKMIVGGLVKDWKQNSSIVYMLEHETVANASIYLDQLSGLIEFDTIKRIASVNDRIGSPLLSTFVKPAGTINASPSSIRYVKHAYDICEIARRKNATNVVVVEVGGGYGGLALTLALVAKHLNVDLKKHIIYDLPDVEMLQHYYLSQHGELTQHVYWGDSLSFAKNVSKYLDEKSHMFLVSNYCMSEIKKEYRKEYLKNLVPYAKSVYMRWNLARYSDLPSTYHIEAEVPDTANGNTIVTY